MNIISLVLAGGAGARMGLTGTMIPKVYLPIGLEPVLNWPVKRALQIEEVRKIYTLTRKKHPHLDNDIDLEAWAEDWRTKYFGNEPRVQRPLYEEDLKEHLDTLDVGAVIALFRAVRFLKSLPDSPSHILILAGDNFIDEPIDPLLRAAREHSNSVVIATRTLPSGTQATRRFGVVEVHQTDGAANKVIGYQEKPAAPRTSTVSIGLYLFPIDQLLRLEPYLTYVNTLPESERRLYLGAPGHFIEWLVSTNSDIWAVPFERGHWIDVGTPSSYLASIVEITRQLIERPSCARELDVLGTTENLSDRFYFTCKRIRVSRQPGHQGSIDLHFQGDDSIAALSSKTDDRFVSIRDIRKKNQTDNSEFWNAVTGSGEIAYGDTAFRDLDFPVLISGGVFLLDRGAASGYARGSALVPFFIRDFGAPVDAGRITTAAGRMDKLDLLDVCVSEHAEEMIFFGTESEHAAETRLMVCAPPRWRSAARASMLSRIEEKGLRLTGVDPQQLSLEAQGPTGLIIEPETTSIRPPRDRSWTVSIYYRDSETAPWTLRHQYEDFVLIPDRSSATLEFRVLWETSLVSGTVRKVGYVGPKHDTRSLGRLRGIVDGDGFRRTAALARAYDLISYVSTMERQRLADILFTSDGDSDDGLKMVAATDGITGRFSSFERRLRIAPLTTSVRYLVELLSELRASG
jgi:NDP-sugar pyrophosphorylase family protein